MLNEKRIKNIIRETINKLISKKDYINEITIGQKYDIESKSNKTKLPFELFSKLCQLDPTTKTNKVGKYANWILAKYQPNVNLQVLKTALEWYADGIKRNILQREGVSPDINTYKSYEEFISTINNKMHSGSAQLSNTEVNHREKLKGQFEIIGSTSKFEIIKPLTFNAERYFGSDTEWCTVANESYFSSYMSRSPLYIVYPKDGNNDYKMQFHEQSHSFADKYDNVYDTISECIFSLFDEDNIQANELRNLCKKIFNPNSIGLTTEEKLKALNGMIEIPNYYFENSKITELIIPNSVTEIGDAAFYRCESLISITIPNSVRTIGDVAFYRCESLTSITIPDSVTTIGNEAFRGCTSLTSITIPDSVTTIGEKAFHACSSLTSITIPKSVTRIEYYTFYGCESLISITIPDSVRTIGDRAFDGCDSLTDTYINIKDLAAYITTSNPEIPGNKHLLVNGKEIIDLVIPNSVTSIKWGAFFNCESLISITIPNSVTEIGDGAFRGCTSLTSITIPNSVTEIGDEAFLYCSSLKEIILPNRFKEDIDFIIGKTNANIRFYGQENISSNNNIQENMSNKKIIISEAQEKLLAKSIKQLINESQESKSIDAAKKLLISKGYTPEQADKFVRIDLRNDIPSLRDSKNAKFILGVTRMFLNRELSDATTILNIDKTIKLLALAHYNEYDRNLNGLSAKELINRFADAKSEQSQEKRNALSTRQFEQRNYNIVKINSFEEASKYSNYTSWCVAYDEDAFNSYTADGEAQFYFCLKNGFENIKPIKGKNCPLDEYGLSMIAVCVDGDGDLKTCTCRWNHDNGGNDNIMNEEQISNIVGVNFYQTFKLSNVIKEKIEALKGMTEIPRFYFQDSKIKKIIIPNNITSIGICAFVDCNSLTTIIIPDSVTTIGNYAFRNCSNLTTITIPDSVTTIGQNTFYECRSLASITIPDSVITIDDGAFFGCSSLISATIPDSVTTIGNAAFSLCSSLTSITIPDSVTTIGEWAFYNCTSLTSITIPDSVTTIGKWAFYNCSGLKEVILPVRFRDKINAIFGETNANFRFYGQENMSLNNNIQENMSNKKFIITETQEKILAQLLKEGIYQMPVDKKMNKPYCVNPEKVLIVKKFLDKRFSAHDYEKIGSNGMPTIIKVISMNASNGEPLKYMYQDQLQDLLIDKFQNMFIDKIERELFMKQVIKDWIAGKINMFGGLSTNRLLAENMTSEEIDERAKNANTNPTDGQKEAGNYSMGHVIVQGMPISIENPKGSKRHWKDEKGNEGYNIMKNHYGYFKKTSGNGKDGDAVDVFIGPNPEEAVTVYVVDQNNKNGEFDESKVMIGFKSITDAKEAYLSNYSKDWKGFRDITGVSILTFKRWLYRKHKQRKPFADYVIIKNKKLE